MHDDISKFIQDESGAITVDWVVLTAGIIGMALLILTTVFSGAEDLSDELGSKLSQQTVGS